MKVSRSSPPQPPAQQQEQLQPQTPSSAKLGKLRFFWSNEKADTGTTFTSTSTPVAGHADDIALSPIKTTILKKTRRKRTIWIATELVVCLVILALLVLHSFRLDKNKNNNTYAQWSSSWVLVLLSVLLVIFCFSVFITFYYYRTVLTWIRDPATSDSEVTNPLRRHARGVGWRFIFSRAKKSDPRTLPQPQSQSPPILQTYSSYHRHLAMQHQHQIHSQPGAYRPWISTHGSNTRAWRQMQRQSQSRSQPAHDGLKRKANRRDSSSSGISSPRAKTSQQQSGTPDTTPRRHRRTDNRRARASHSPQQP